MKNNTFESLIRATQGRALPLCPGNLEANVLRRVRIAKVESNEINILDWLFGQIQGRRVALGALTLALFLSISTSMTVASRAASAADHQRLAVSSLDFEVFEQMPILNFD